MLLELKAQGKIDGGKVSKELFKEVKYIFLFTLHKIFSAFNAVFRKDELTSDSDICYFCANDSMTNEPNASPRKDKYSNSKSYVQ